MLTKLFVILGLVGQILCVSRCQSDLDQVALLSDQAQQNEQAQEEATSPLISIQQLKSEIESNEQLVIIDLGPEKEAYLKGHIPGALFVDWVDDITDLERPIRYNIASKDKIQKLLRRLGVQKDSQIVLYDDLNSRVSTRMYWTLKYYGLTNLKVLNGGRPAWTQADFPMQDDAPQPTASNIVLGAEKSEMAAKLDFVADRLQNPNVSLIDGRPANQYSGAVPGKVFHTGNLHDRLGHIPGAINIFWKDNFNSDGTFKSVAELEELYKDVTGSELVVTYCNEGLHAVPPWFVLSELLGHGNVRVYDSSMVEWTKTDQPMEKSDK